MSKISSEDKLSDVVILMYGDMIGRPVSPAVATPLTASVYYTWWYVETKSRPHAAWSEHARWCGDSVAMTFRHH